MDFLQRVGTNFLKRFYLFIHRDREREAETQAEGKARSMQGAQCGTRSWVSGITPWTEGGAKLLSHPGCPLFFVFFKILFIYSRETQRKSQRHRQREKQAPCREPDVGLDPGSPGSHVGPKAVLNHRATQAARYMFFY